MNFRNEYASDEDVNAYGLNEIWDRYHPFRKGRFFGGSKPDFTIDRANNRFLLALEVGMGESGDEVKFLLWIQKKEVIARLRQHGGSKDLNDNPFRIKWHLVDLALPQEMVGQQQDVVALLKEALSVRGYWGAQEQRSNTVVEFTF